MGSASQTFATDIVNTSITEGSTLGFAYKKYRKILERS